MEEAHKVRLTKIKSTHNILRTDVIEGESPWLPEVGKAVIVTGEGLEFGYRVVHTTTIQSMEKIDNVYRFKTRNSTYELEVLDE